MRMRKLWRLQTGSVSIALLLLISPMFVLHAAFIDVARLKIAEKQSESALKAALRSVLSAYDPALQSYGLYGLGYELEQSSAMLSDVMRENLSASGKLADVEPVSETLTPLYSLANRFVFERQILEEMKYRAPIEFALQVADIFESGSQTSDMLAGFSRYSKQAEQIEQFIEQRESELAAVWNDAAELVEKASIYRGYYASQLGRLDEMAKRIGIRDVEDVQSTLQTMKIQVAELAKTLSQMKLNLSELLKNAEKLQPQIAELTRSIAVLEQSAAELNTKIGELEQVLRDIAEYVLLMGALKAEAKRDNARIFADVQVLMIGLDRAKSWDDRIRNDAQSFADQSPVEAEHMLSAMLPDSYYVKYKSGISGIGALFNGFEAALDATPYLHGSGRMDELAASNDAYAQSANRFFEAQRTEEERRRSAADAVSARKREHRTALSRIWDQAKKTWAECGPGTEELYRRLEIGGKTSGEPSLFRKYADFNRMELGAEEIDFEVLTASDGAADLSKITGLIDGLLDSVSAASGQFRDELYLNEYTLSKFTYRSYGKETNKDGSVKHESELSNRGSHELYRQEAEYVLYGLDSCVKNHAAAYSEMFALRLAIRSAEALGSAEAKAAGAGSPVVAVLWAMAEGAGRAYSDMTRLVNGEEIPLSSKLPATIALGYKDYLRVFLLLHTRKEPMIARLQSLIEINTKRDLRHVSAYVQASAETAVRLWFMPYTVKLLGYPTKRNEAVIAKTAALSY